MTNFNIKKGYSIPEIFDLVREQETINEKVRKLKEFDGKGIRWYVDALFNKDFTFVGRIDYKPSDMPHDMQYSKIQHVIPRLENVLKHSDKPNVYHKNAVLALESVSNSEAELLMKLFTGDSKIEGIHKSVFKKAYPEFFRDTGMDAQTENKGEAK